MLRKTKPGTDQDPAQTAGTSGLLAGIAAMGSALLLAACGGGGTPPPPKPTSVLGVADVRTVQGTAGEALLAYRVALVNSPLYPLDFAFQVSGGQAGTSCTGGADYYIPSASGLTVDADGSGGRLTISSAAASRKIQVMACPGSDASNTPLTLTWNEATGSGSAIGVIRGAGNNDLTDSKILNDTGITTCATDTANGQACPQSEFPGQDGQYGRDTAATITGTGVSSTTAFAFTAVGDCIQDNVTGLIWEGKASTAGLQAAANRYTWYNTEGASNGGAAGAANGGSCTGSSCDTADYVAKVNAAAVCGFADWRLPTVQELTTLLDSSVASGASVNSAISNQVAGLYWTAVSNASPNDRAWVVDFDSGVVASVAKSDQAYVRLVRGR